MTENHEPITDRTNTNQADTDQADGDNTQVASALPLVSWWDEPVRVSFTGEPPDEDWPLGNTITVEVVDNAANPGFDPDAAEAEAEREWAADTDTRPLVRLDANYKASRPGPHPVDLTRTAAVAVAAAVLRAVEDTFHQSRVGSLRATEALALLEALADVDEALIDLRTHAVTDLGAAPERAQAARDLHTQAGQASEGPTDTVGGAR